MKRKPKSSGGANWMDTYGDMVTLLLCFFVLLYSMSSISEDKWRAVVMSFNPDAQETMTENSGNNGPIADSPDDGIGLDKGLIDSDEESEMEKLFLALKAYAEREENKETISVTQGDGKIFISFNQTVFFDGDSPVLRSDAFPVLDEVCRMLDQTVKGIEEIRVLGHTAQGDPSVPNNVTVDRTLSSDRATNVVIYVQEHCKIEPSRLISEGVGQWRPVSSNDTEEGRSKNRRVEMIISGRDLEEKLDEDITSYESQPHGG